jgi:uncharacterized protein (DUF1778 family)
MQAMTIATDSLTEPPGRRETLNMRIATPARLLIDRAADIAGKTRTDFILEAAQKAAEDVLLDQSLHLVGPDAYAAFISLLDAPARSNEALRRTMQAPAPWDQG